MELRIICREMVKQVREKQKMIIMAVMAASMVVTMILPPLVYYTYLHIYVYLGNQTEAVTADFLIRFII